MIKIENFENVLVLAPHTDDGELGCGGFISKLIERGSNVTYVAFSTAEESVPAGFPRDILKTEVREATMRLGISQANLILFNYQVRKLGYVRQEILEKLVALNKDGNYDLVLMPSINDIHQDHSTVANEGLRAFKKTTILGYELIWNNLNFNTQCFTRLEHRHIQKKTYALRAYVSQGTRDYLSEEFIYALAKARGVQVGYEYAESFEVVRLFI